MSDKEDYDIWYVCKICHEAFPDKEDLGVHKKTKHVAVCPRRNQLSDVEIKENFNLRPSEDIIANNEKNFPKVDKRAEQEDVESEIEKDWPILDDTLENLKTVIGVQITQSKSKYPDKVEDKIKMENEYIFNDTEVESMKETCSQFTSSKKRNRGQLTSVLCAAKRNQKLIECAICNNASTSELMIGCNSCTVHFHVTCVGSKDGPIVKDNEVYCVPCAVKNQQDEYENSEEINAFRNIQRRGKSRKVDNLCEVVVSKPETRIKISSEGQKLSDDNKLEKFIFYECDQCTKLFISKVNMEKHYKIHDNGKKTANSCQEKIFSMNPLDLSCPICPLTFNQKVDQIIHIASHAAENRISTKVNKEKFSVKIPSSSRKLEAVKISETVSRAGKNFRKRKNHRSFDKSTTERHQCTWCEKEFKKLSQLTEHMGMHTGEKSHQCNYCSKYFRFGSGLSRHVKIIHPHFFQNCRGNFPVHPV